MEYIIGIIIFTSLALFIIKYLKYKRNYKHSKIIIAIIFLNLIFYGSIIIAGTINNIKNEKDFNSNIQLYSKDHPDYGLLKDYDSLTDEEKRIYNYHIGDGGRKVFTYIIIPITFILNIVLIIFLYFLIESKYFKKNN
jgi:hypothetical protein